MLRKMPNFFQTLLFLVSSRFLVRPVFSAFFSTDMSSHREPPKRKRARHVLKSLPSPRPAAPKETALPRSPTVPLLHYLNIINHYLNRINKSSDDDQFLQNEIILSIHFIKKYCTFSSASLRALKQAELRGQAVPTSFAYQCRYNIY